MFITSTPGEQSLARSVRCPWPHNPSRVVNPGLLFSPNLPLVLPAANVHDRMGRLSGKVRFFRVGNHDPKGALLPYAKIGKGSFYPIPTKIIGCPCLGLVAKDIFWQDKISNTTLLQSNCITFNSDFCININAQINKI